MISSNVRESVSLVGGHIESSEHSFYSQRKKNQRIELKTYNSICYLKNGSVSVYRLADNILTLSISAPAILGLPQMRSETKQHYLRCDTDCEMWVLDTPNAIDLFSKNNLWIHAFDILTRHLELYFQRENMHAQPTIRGVVLEHLRYIWSMPESKRLTTSVYTFILARNQISRSAVHKEMKELSDREIIRLERGKLLWFNEEFISN